MGNEKIIAVSKLLCPFGAPEPDHEVVRDFLDSIPIPASLLLRLLFWLFYWLPPLIVFRFRTFIQLDPESTERYLRWWEESRWAPIREAFVALKTVALLAQVGREWEPQ